MVGVPSGDRPADATERRGSDALLLSSEGPLPYAHIACCVEDSPGLASCPIAHVAGAELVLLSGLAAGGVCDWAREACPDLLLAGAHRGRRDRLTLGSFAGCVAYHAPCNVLLVRPDAR